MKALFLEYGPFSHVNDKVLPELKAADPSIEWRVHRIRDMVMKRPTALARAGLEATLRRPVAVAKRAGLEGLAFRTVAAWDAMTACAQEVIAQNPDIDFVLETQTLFNGRAAGKPFFIFTDHTHMANLYFDAYDPANQAPRAWIAREKACYAQADRVFVFANHVSRSLVEHYGLSPDRAPHVGLGWNAQTSDIVRERPPGAGRRILFIGIDWERKGGPVLVDAVTKLRTDVPDVELVIAGANPDLDPAVATVLGRIPLERVREEMAKADVFCMPSKIEPAGAVGLESLAAGLPVVLPALGGFLDYVKDGETGWLFKPGDADALTAALKDAFSHPERLAEMGRKGRASVLGYYGWDKTAQRMLEHIRRDVRAKAA
ncbi:MAG: glycosyltransferase family 4 protein [Pseudomonadota bacterium]